MARERRRDVWRRRLFGSQDRDTAASPQADDSKSVSSTSELVPTVLSPHRANTPDPKPTKQLEALEIQHKEPETPNDVWAAAFRKFQESDGDLAKAYAKVINPAHEEDTAEFDVNFVESTVKNLEKKRDEKQWKVAFAGKSIHVRSQVEKMVKFLLWTDTVVKPALSTQPYAALAWSAVSILLPLVNAGTELHEAMITGLEEINRTLVFWKISESSVYPFRSHARESFYDVFIDLHRQMIRYYAHAVCHLSSTQTSRARENLFGWNGWKAETKSVNELNQNCQTYLEAAQRKASEDGMEMQLVEIHNSRLALEDIARRLEEIQFRYEDQIEGEILKSLHADFKGHKNANPERVQGTCEWVLQDPKFHRWRDSESSSLLWISAGPGYGKSVLSRALIDENLLRCSERATTSSVCYFFFKDGDEKRMRACDAVAALLHQIFAQDLTGNLIKKAKAPYHRAGAGLRDSFDELCDILTSCVHSPDAGEIICVLDALDECETKERKRLVDYLKNFYDTYEHESPPTSSLKFVITSRSWKAIQFSLQDLFEPEHPSQSSHINGDKTLLEISKEIELVIEENLPTITGHLSKSDQEDIGKYLKAMENRTYLWLRLVFQMIKEEPTEYMRKSDILQLFESLPAEVSEVYEQVLGRLNDDMKSKTEYLFQLMLAAPLPLQVREADEALTIFSSRPNQWKSLKDFDENCWGEGFSGVVQNWTGFLVIVTKNRWDEEELYFLHQTVREFLLSPKHPPGSWKGRFSYPETQAAMLSSCLQSLHVSLLPLEQGTEGDEEGICFDSGHFERYAANYWPHHYAKLDRGQQEEYYDQVRSLCDVAQPGTAKWLAHNISLDKFRKSRKLKLTSFDQLSLSAFFGLAHLFEKIAQTNLADSRQAMSNKVSPLQAASWNGQLEMVKMLVQRNADIDYDPLNIGSPFEFAIYHGNIGTVEFLLTCTPAPIITEDTLELAERHFSGRRILNLILQRLPETQISTKLLETAAQLCGGHMLRQLLHERPTLIPSYQTILSAIRNGDCDVDVLDFLLSRRSDLHVTEKMVEEACARRYGALEMLKFLYERSPDAKASDRALAFAAGNLKFGLDIVKFFSEKHPDLKIPAQAFCSAAQNHETSVEILRLLFGIEEGKQITTDLVVSALKNYRRGKATLDFLACQDGFGSTQGYLETWFQNHGGLGQFFYFNVGHLMRLGRDEITVTETMMKELASWRYIQVKPFLKDIGSDFSIFITDNIYNGSHQACQASRGPDMSFSHRYDRFETMEILVGAHGVDIQMKGSDGHRLSKDEVMDKLASWKKELDDFYANVDSIDDTIERSALVS